MTVDNSLAPSGKHEEWPYITDEQRKKMMQEEPFVAIARFFGTVKEETRFKDGND